MSRSNTAERRRHIVRSITLRAFEFEHALAAPLLLQDFRDRSANIDRGDHRYFTAEKSEHAGQQARLANARYQPREVLHEPARAIDVTDRRSANATSMSCSFMIAPVPRRLCAPMEDSNATLVEETARSACLSAVSALAFSTNMSGASNHLGVMMKTPSALSSAARKPAPSSRSFSAAARPTWPIIPTIAYLGIAALEALRR